MDRHSPPDSRSMDVKDREDAQRGAPHRTRGPLIPTHLRCAGGCALFLGSRSLHQELCHTVCPSLPHPSPESCKTETICTE